MKSYSNQELAARGEFVAAKYLERQGYRLVCRNFRCPQGEIDLIVEKDQQLIFVEVKTRSHHTIDSAVENINFRKQRKISLTAFIYTKQNPQFDKHNTRFDAIILLYDRCEDAFSVRHFEDAFLPVGIDPES